MELFILTRDYATDCSRTNFASSQVICRLTRNVHNDGIHVLRV